MGNDGGSIPKRDDLVRTKRAAERGDKRAARRMLFLFCALSKDPLRQPVVSCPLGKLYNKEAVISFLLSPETFGTDGQQVASHIRSLKDVITLNLTLNPSLANDVPNSNGGSGSGNGGGGEALMGAQEGETRAPFVCPITMREMNGSVKFLYRKPGGSVLSESALKEMRKRVDPLDKEAFRTDPVTGKKDDEKVLTEEWVTINPEGEELETVKQAWEAKKLKEKEEKKTKKRKDDGSNGTEKDKESNKKAKKALLATQQPAPSVNAGSSIPSLSASLAAKLAEQKKTISPAIASLYAAKDDGSGKDKDGRSNWMTRGAFTRYA